MNELYITLPSNTDPNNKTGDFTVHLPATLQLDGNWEVGLSEIIYPHTWVNLHSYLEKDTGMRSTAIIVEFYEGRPMEIIVPSANFENITELLTAITQATIDAVGEYKLRSKRDDVIFTADLHTMQEKLVEEQNRQEVAKESNLKEVVLQRQRIMELVSKFDEKFKFEYDQITKRVCVFFDEGHIGRIVLSEHLQNMLGFESKYLTETGESAKYMSDMNSGVQALYLYTNFIEPQMIGTGYHQVLRIIHVDNTEFNRSVEKVYYAPHYLPVSVKQLSFIRIRVGTDSGALVPFMSGKIICKLHLRKKRLFIE